ncbi:hypothetical protein ACEN2I_09760 [Flavobacterium sp. W22_SRS_FK3]|uniref:hypothetical protein n=1 Tax=Flavobacterium sp. W22_SRS_FK3 TaxID=3240275 RepID=UPI003F8EA42A
MKKLSFIVFVFCLLLSSCSSDESSQEEETKNLEKMYNEIITLSLSNSEPCTNPKEWFIASIGSKPCGGDGAYILYSKKTNINTFFAKVKKYTEAQNTYNKKWGIGSDCSITVKPTGVECIDGKPKLSYSNQIYTN